MEIYRKHAFMKIEKILLFEVRRESVLSLPARACPKRIGDAIVEDPQLWNHVSRRSGPRAIFPIW